MRTRRTQQNLSVRAISGTYVVMLGIDFPQELCDGLRGFAIQRTDHTENESYWMKGLKTFAATDPGFPAGSSYSTRNHPIQGFGWSDYSAKPGHRYTYRVEALTGPPGDLKTAHKVSVPITTESPVGGDHDIYFNRGVAASQAYSNRFGGRDPREVGEAAFDWLSRGLYESIIGFIDAASGPAFGLRVAAYEFHQPAVLAALRAAHDRGVDVHIVYDNRTKQPGEKNTAAVVAAQLSAICTPRRTHRYIAHNKFIVRLKNSVPEAVLTGGTNFSEGGIFGHSNVVHVVESNSVAAEFLRYWNLLAADPTNADLKPVLTDTVQLTARRLPPSGTTAVFSPRRKTDALDLYTYLAETANDSLFTTFAFGMHSSFQRVYRSGQAPLRYAVMEKKTRPMAPGPERLAAEASIDLLRSQPENLFAIGSRLTADRFDRWVKESHNFLNSNVRYIHNKFMLVDPLSSSPVVVAGSANFSEASCVTNDENMLMIRDNTRVADIYLGEFMRLYNHHAFREFLERNAGSTTPVNPSHLRLDDWWRGYFGNTSRSRQRRLFAGS